MESFFNKVLGQNQQNLYKLSFGTHQILWKRVTGHVFRPERFIYFDKLFDGIVGMSKPNTEYSSLFSSPIHFPLYFEMYYYYWWQNHLSKASKYFLSYITLIVNQNLT